jgi:hypothetical protein
MDIYLMSWYVWNWQHEYLNEKKNHKIDVPWTYKIQMYHDTWSIIW